MNDDIPNIIRDRPEKKEENKVNNEKDEKSYLKICYNLSKLYNSLFRDIRIMPIYPVLNLS